MSSYLILNKQGNEIKVLIRHSKRTKKICIRVKDDKVELVLPYSRWKDKAIQDGYKFLLEKESWIRKKLSYQEQFNINWDNETLPIYDKNYKLLYINNDRHNVIIKENIIYVYSNPNLHIQTLINFLKNKLLLKITDEVNNLSLHFDKKVAEIKIVNNKSKWGSCSSKGVLCFNWRLILAPENIIKYVVIHEICHLVEMNHSKSFWQVVAKFYRDYKSAKLWLRQNGNRLYKYLN